MKDSKKMILEIDKMVIKQYEIKVNVMFKVNSFQKQR